MNIPQEAIDAAADVHGQLDGSDLQAIAEASLHAALPFLLSDYRERSDRAIARLEEKLTGTASIAEVARLRGKIDGVKLDRSYLDELTR